MAPLSIKARSILFLFLVLFSQDVLSSSSSSAVEKTPTAYDILSDYNFPMGILPKGVLGYDLDPATGQFAAFFNATCSFSLEGSYQLRYRPTIRGHISKGRLAGLQGVSVKLLFMWVDIVEVSRSGDVLDFSVGIAGAGFPVDNFEESPQCGCGLKCGDRKQVINLRTNPFVSSS
ncbi:hypothetical protein Tsubulata_032036 [Turnera subulata]|uniref:Uncharacterized protein n=1 Tax=Turnera subulata TaxID=218843 RepID=A0A9Q0J5H8_9ROSI|nr:hypothetical protein Tsubulata_032036 [Turnera subulata]